MSINWLRAASPGGVEAGGVADWACTQAGRATASRAARRTAIRVDCMGKFQMLEAAHGRQRHVLSSSGPGYAAARFHAAFFLGGFSLRWVWLAGGLRFGGQRQNAARAAVGVVARDGGAQGMCHGGDD